MNGYLAKPVTKSKLLEALQLLNKPQGSTITPEGDKITLNELKVLDAESVVENLGFDLDTYRMLVDMYLAKYVDVGDQLAEKLAGDNLTEIKEYAHSLKGIVANIGGLKLTDIANRIQEMCREGHKPDCTEWAPLVKAQSAALKEALELLDWSALERFAAEN